MRRILATVLLLNLVSAGALMAQDDDVTRERVRERIGQAVTAKTQDEQQAAFDALIAFGCEAVPEIAAAMEDRRTLPFAYIRLGNESAAAIEGSRQYGPEVVTDALAAILNHLTGQHFGFIYNGTSNDKRRSATKSWQSYVRETPLGEICG